MSLYKRGAILESSYTGALEYLSRCAFHYMLFNAHLLREALKGVSWELQWQKKNLHRFPLPDFINWIFLVWNLRFQWFISSVSISSVSVSASLLLHYFLLFKDFHLCKITITKFRFVIHLEFISIKVVKACSMFLNRNRYSKNLWSKWL